MIFFCPNCGSDIKEKEIICPKCRTEIGPLDQRNYFEKLVGALRHPEATTKIRAAYILGEIGDQRAIQPFCDILDQSWNMENLFFLREIAFALGKIDGDEAVPALVRMLTHPSIIIRESALKALGEIKNEEAAGALRKALNDPNPGLRALARDILEKNFGD